MPRVTTAGVDPYLWLENIEDKKVVDWARSQNKRFQTKLRPRLPKMEKSIRRYYNARTIIQVKVTDAGTYFLERRPNEFTIRLEDQIVVSSKSLGKDYVIFTFYTDKEGDRLAYFASHGEDYGILKVMRVTTGERIAELEGDIGDVVFLSEDFYYVKDFRKENSPDGIKPPTSRVMKGEKMVFGKGVPSREFILLKESHGKALVTISKWSRTEIFCGGLEKPKSWKKCYGGNFLSFPLEFVRNRPLILSYEGNGNGQIVLGSHKLVKETKDVLRSASVVGNEIICNYMKDCVSYLRIVGLDGRPRKTFEPDFQCSIDSMSSNEERAVIVASSFGTPYVTYEYAHGSFRSLDRLNVSDMMVTDEYARSRDGTPIHYFVLGKPTKKVLIWGYGGFSIPRTPIYDPLYCALVDHGVTCIVTNLRGGNEYGESWHKAGRRHKKQNVFDDFTAVIKNFKKRGCKVVAFGRSNGGLLVGATITQNPSLVNAAVIGYPVLDMLRFHKLSVGSFWMDEYGNPDSKKDRAYLFGYSPYHNVRKSKYPPTLIYTSLHDDRVHPAHAFKFAAKLGELDPEVWLRVQEKGGHAGSSSKTKVKEIADVASFSLYELNKA